MTYQLREKLKCIECGSEPTVARKLCRKCYSKRWHRKALGDTPILGPHDVFLTRIEKQESCWVWLGTRNQQGYGLFMMPGGFAMRAHRFSYEYFKGPIPEGLIVMHTCDNPPCVNPEHLRLGTKADNNRDTAQKRRHHYGLDHWNGRLSESDVRTILTSPLKNRDLAVLFSVHPSHISRIRGGWSRKQ